jgi:DNA-directed RNA polymerase specialized sigma24 family protein
MNGEQKQEIVKSLVFAMEPDEIAKLEGISVVEIMNILNDNQDEINEIRDYYSGMGGG